MRKYLAATAVLSSALLLAACSGDDSSTPESPAATDEAPATDAPVGTPTVETVEPVASCAGVFDGGEWSLATSIETHAELIDAELSPEDAAAVTTTTDKIAAVQGRADESILEYLTTIRTPFDEALAGQVGDPEVVTAALDDFRTVCGEAGYEFRS